MARNSRAVALQNITYSFREDVPRVNDSNIPICIKCPSGQVLKVHAHLMKFASNYFLKLMSRPDYNAIVNQLTGVANPGTSPSAQKVELPMVSIQSCHIFAPFPLSHPVFYRISKNVVELFVRWAYKRCERQASTGAPLTPSQLATYFIYPKKAFRREKGRGWYDLSDPNTFVQIGGPVDTANYNELNSYLKAPRYSFMDSDVLLGAWMLGEHLEAPEFQNTVMSILYAYTEARFTARERCGMALCALSPDEKMLPIHTQQPDSSNPRPSKGQLFASFIIPPDSALEHFLFSRAAVYLLTPRSEKISATVSEIAADSHSFDHTKVSQAIRDFMVQLLRAVPMDKKSRLLDFLVMQCGAKRLGNPGPVDQVHRMYV
ncbi:hypothetical protein F4810DRAFT_710327 [Camillea tinctor]|nr:hypothetical protein F4810DRAFT_710327 [Camillea tinctor]